jgi:hypothetical protein
MKHEPRRLLRDAKSARQFIRANSILAIRQQPHGREPLLMRNRGILEYRPDLERELRTRMLAVALPAASVNHVRNMLGVADWTPDNTVWPSGLDHELAAAFIIAEKLDRFQERFRCIIIVSHG